MSILFVLLMFLLIMTISSFRRPQPQPTPAVFAADAPRAPRMQREYGFEIPQGYCFHPGHTWALKEGPETARVGLDSFATRMFGKIDRVEVIGLNRWVRQGQKLLTIHSNGRAVDLMSPVEGVVTALNQDVTHDPSLVARDPFQQGWIAMVKAPDLALNQNNLVQAGMVAPWLQNSVTRLNGMLNQASPALAQDGGLPLDGVLDRVSADVRENLVREFFLCGC